MIDLTRKKIVVSIANVVHAWLSYLYEVSNTEHLTAESSICYPITGLLERDQQVEVEMKKHHPIFGNKRVDFYWKIKEGEQIYNCYMEMKYKRHNTGIGKDIIFDLFRLSMIQMEGTYKYFLLCGKEIDFKNILNNDPQAVEVKEGKVVAAQSQPEVDPDKNETILSLNFLDEEALKDATKIPSYTFKEGDAYFDEFIGDTTYFPVDGSIAKPKQIKINTQLVQPYSKNLKSAVAIWEITSEVTL